MIRYLRDLRLIPIALIASACLLALKATDLILDRGLWFAADDVPASSSGGSVVRNAPDEPTSPALKLSWAQKMFNFPDSVPRPIADIAPPAPLRSAAQPNSDITGSISSQPAAPGSPPTGGKDAKLGTASNPLPPPGTVIPQQPSGVPAGAERAILERLAERRQELDTRARELDIRESLLKAAEKQIEARLAEIKDVESRIVVETQQKDDAEAARFKGLVTMYENMKPREAAKIFDRLDTDVLIQVASKINPRQMSEILAQMSADVAQRLTVELASKARHTAKNGPGGLPKIEGRPVTP